MTGELPSQPKATVLVVDDEAAVRRVLVMRLQLSGYRVVCAEDGEQALELFHSESPDLIVLDVMLPKLDGFAVCRRLRAESCVPIIFLSAVEAISERVAGLDLGADDYLPKPFSPKELEGPHRNDSFVALDAVMPSSKAVNFRRARACFVSVSWSSIPTAVR
jgi:CheY-like chemotaxis protein